MNSLALIKTLSMIVMFSIVMIVGILPVRMEAFKSNQKLLAFSASFAGGLFLSVGLLHLMPEAQEKFEDWDEQKENRFPFASLITVCSFGFILFIEKVVANHENVEDIKASLFEDEKQSLLKKNNSNIVNGETYKEAVNTQMQMAKKISFAQSIKKSMVQTPSLKRMNIWAPYILQIAIGIHAIFEGLSIGIQTQTSICLGIAAAVLFHKWAEALTLGLAFRQAQVDKTTSTIMIGIQAAMNPLGIGIGWALSEAGPLTTGIFLAISTGTFIYIATIEVIIEEFSISRYKWIKFLIFISAIGFVSVFYFLEKATEE